MHDVTLLLSTRQKLLLVHGTVGRMLAYLNYHMYIVFEVVYTLVGRLIPGSDLLV